MSRKNISQEKIIQSFIANSFEKSPGATSLADISEDLEIKKASLYNHFESRDAMYDATLEYCAREVATVSFLPEKTIETLLSKKPAAFAIFKRLILRYFNIYEAEPLFQIYVFARTEQYFNLPALKIVRAETESICEDVFNLLNALSKIDKIQKKSEKELRDYAGIISSIIIQQRDLYIANRKETVRQNPESGAGSLFALPTDETSINKTVKLVELVLKNLITE